MNRKRFVILAAILCLCFLLSACIPPKGPSDSEKPNEVEQPSGTEQPDKSEQPGQSEPSHSDQPNDTDKEEISKMYITIYGNRLEVTLADNSSVTALIELLKKGDITYTANDYGNFEKVGNIGHSLPQNNTQISTEAGDVILYQGNQICLYYGNNSWNFTRIGKIKGYSASELRNLLGAGKGSTEVTISLN